MFNQYTGGNIKQTITSLPSGTLMKTHPNPNSKDTVYCLFKDEDGQVKIGSVLFLETESDDSWRDDPDMQLTEQEIRKDFEWAWQWKKEVTE